MFTKFNSFILAIIVTLTSVTTMAQTTDVLVEKIAYCRTAWPICNDKLMEEYHWWEDNGVPDQAQKRTYIGRYNEPAKADTRNLVLIASGQRWDTGNDNLLTGQPDWSPYSDDEATEWFSIDPNSIAYRLLSEDVYDESDTFIALAFDARFNWGFSQDNKRDIVNAYFDWLKSKVQLNTLESVYLAGHSRGGALVLRLAQKFQQEMPNVPVIVHTFDPVARSTEGELGTYNDYINNPTVDYPRDSNLVEDKGNWSWKTNIINQYPNKVNLSIYNLVNGGNIGFPARFTRSLTHESATEENTDLGWYRQQWFPVSSNAGGHNGIARSYTNVTYALSHLKSRLKLMRNNMAPHASVSASSTYCTSASNALNCYSASRINDKNLDSRVGGQYSWTNNSTTLPQWVRLSWAQPIRASKIEVITSQGYPIQNFQVQTLEGSNWRTIATVNSNTQLRREVRFLEVNTQALRILATSGPSNQPQYVRINEVLVEGEWETPPNVPPTAQCRATPDYGQGTVHSTLDGSNSSDSDGSIVNYHWTFSNGAGPRNGAIVNQAFSGVSYGTMHYTATLTVTDDRGGTDTASCNITVLCYSYPYCS
ncbi:hypothetical protein TDB9533_03778 [Thalassocella blandensis]|nr:hypothetical protein TDB9533_03778 [Thalassocella blandensis]